MTTSSKTRSAPLDAAATAPRYQDDLYGWVEDQIALLRADEVGSIDASQITQELTDLGKSEFDKLVSTIRIVLHHLLKWDHQPERRSRSWATTIREHRRRIAYQVKDSPSLKPRVNEAIVRAYLDAIDDVTRETGLRAAILPETCPYDWNDITLRPILWDDANPR
jgi:hypothetical protein